MQRKVLIAILTCFFLFLTRSGVFAQAFTPGTLTDSVICRHDPTQSYALYLPESWNPEAPSPILYFFEPLARGKLPVEKYRDLADQYHLILVGSHTSRNGSWEVAFGAANALFADTWSRFQIDSTRIYLAGFSGGARVATALALESGKIRGVIGCGAGFPALEKWQPRANLPFLFAGIVGDLDMNWLEMHDTERLLTELEASSRLITFHGPHQWPDPPFLAQALDFFVLQEQSLPSSDWISARILERKQLASAFNLDGFPLQSFDANLNLWRDFGKTAAANQVSQVAEFANRPELREAIRENDRFMELERRRREEIEKHFLFNFENYRDSAVFAWWELEGKSLTRARASKDAAEAAMAERLTRMIGARAVETTIPAEDYPRQISLNKIWALTEPDAIYPLYRLSLAYAGQGEDNLAFSSLKMAIKAGLHKKSRLTDPPEFQKYQEQKKFRKLLEQLPD
ncbi:MAG: hypothetical protein H6581_25140 [Bacteroidia bacterium]|nr:hypothetical protein [Bacteroidia bacterium]